MIHYNISHDVIYNYVSDIKKKYIPYYQLFLDTVPKHVFLNYNKIQPYSVLKRTLSPLLIIELYFYVIYETIQYLLKLNYIARVI